MPLKNRDGASPLVTIDPKDATPVYAQLERGIRGAVASGRLRQGDQLPTVRQMAIELRLNANTVARVYTELERVGVLETRRGVGSFIRVKADNAWAPLEREKRLRAFVTRTLADACAAGFAIEDVIDELEADRAKAISKIAAKTAKEPAVKRKPVLNAIKA